MTPPDSNNDYSADKTVETTTTVEKDTCARELSQEPCLLFVSGIEAGRLIDLGHWNTTYGIGRSSDSDIQIDGPEISRHHAQLEQQLDGALELVDLDSKNGTFVNNKPIKRKKLKPNDKLQIGPYHLLKLLYQDEEEIRHAKTLFNRSITDHLTGVINRRYFLRTLEREWSFARRHEMALALAMLDLDHFKKVNDTYGHVIGDQVLVEFAHRVMGQIRREDFLARYGGEEFISLLPGTDKTGAFSLAERIRQQISKEPFVVDEQDIPVSVSIGVVSFDTKDLGATTPETMLREVDKQLYRAKSNGRNCVWGV